MQFMGYRRQDGKAGTRNHVLILPTCACASECCRIVSSQVKGTVNVIFHSGCADVRSNAELNKRMLIGLACNPNVYGVVIIGLGCETLSHAKLKEEIKKLSAKPVASFGIQEEGGTINTASKAIRAALAMTTEASHIQRSLCDISDIVLGLECGGSDGTSGLAANPVLGCVSDKLVDSGATTIMSETTEWIGAEHILAKRAATPEIHNKIIDLCHRYEIHLKQAGQNCRDGQPTPGNKAGGLSTLEEKSLGCIKKGGTRPIVEVLEQAEMPKCKGAILMDTPGYDIASVTAMVAGGCTAIIFTTGCGTPTGNAISPVLKVTANEQTYKSMRDNIDMDLSPVITGTQNIEEMADRLLQDLIYTCSGRLTKAEIFGFSDIAVDQYCRYV